jgi:hypothetical protein
MYTCTPVRWGEVGVVVGWSVGRSVVVHGGVVVAAAAVHLEV